jgi:hypothetical protein
LRFERGFDGAVAEGKECASLAGRSDLIAGFSTVRR